MASLDDNSLYDTDSEDFGRRRKRKHQYDTDSEDYGRRKERKRRKRKKQSDHTVASNYEGVAFTDKMDAAVEECSIKERVSFGLEHAFSSNSGNESRRTGRNKEKRGDVIVDNASHVGSAKLAEECSNLNSRNQVCDTREAHHSHQVLRRDKNGKKFRDSGTPVNDGAVKRHKDKKLKKISENSVSGNEDVCPVTQCEQAETDEKENHTNAELEECNKNDIFVERKKKCDAEHTGCRDETSLLFSDENLNNTPGRARKKSKYKAITEILAQADSGTAVPGLHENCADKHSTFSKKSDRMPSKTGGDISGTLWTPRKKKRYGVARENFQEGTNCLTDQQRGGCENNETCRSVGDGQCDCCTKALHKKKTRKLKPAMECADQVGDYDLSGSTEELSDNAPLIDDVGESTQLNCEHEKQSEMGLGTSLLKDLGELPLRSKGGGNTTKEDSSMVAFKKKRKLARLSTSGSEFFFSTDDLQPDADSSETASKTSERDEGAAPEDCDNVSSADLSSANKEPKLHEHDTPGTSYERPSSAESSQGSTERASRFRRRSESPSDPEFLAYMNGQRRFPTIHFKTKPSLDATLHYEKVTGLTIDTGKYTPEEDSILLKNIHEISKYYKIAHPFMIVGHCGDEDPNLQKEVKDLVRKEQLTRFLGIGLPCRTIHSAYMRARLLLDPLASPKISVLTPKQKECLQRLYAQHGPKWTLMSQKMGLSAEQLRSAFRYLKEKQSFATGKWEKAEDELLRQAVKRQTGGRPATLKEINWKAVSKHVRTRNALQCRRHWILTQLAPPPGQETRKWNKFDSIHLIHLYKSSISSWRLSGRLSGSCHIMALNVNTKLTYRMNSCDERLHKLNASRSTEIDWEALGKSFPWAPSPLVAKYHWESTLNGYLRPEQRDNFKSKVKNLYDIALPSLLKKIGKGKTLEEIIELSKSPPAVEGAPAPVADENSSPPACS